MRSLVALVKKDLKGYFDQPTGYILIVIFVGLLSYWFFDAAIPSGEASLRPLFDVEFTIDHPSLPWLLAMFVPAATMRLLAEEQRDGTLEILLTQPIPGWIVLIGKFLSGFIFTAVAILATIGIPIAMQTAGDLDVGAVVAQYIGTFFLAASLVAIGLFTSSLTRNQIVAFILGLTLIVLLMLVGLERVAVTLPPRLATLLQTLSPVTHFSSIARGVIDLRDVLYFLALISTFLSAAYLMIRSKSLSHKSIQYRNLQLGVAGLIVLSMLVGWFGNSIGGRLDLTADKLFSLSDGTKEILSGLDDILTVKLYRSKSMPPQVSLVARDVEDFLLDFSSSNDEVEFVRKTPDVGFNPAEYNPFSGNHSENEKAAREAQLAGVGPRQFNLISQGDVQIKAAYLGVVMTYADRREVIPFVGSVDGFEYSIASLVNKMTLKNKKTVAFLAGFGDRRPATDMRFLGAGLSEQYDVTEIQSTEDGLLDLSGVDVLVLAGPNRPIPQGVRDELHRYLERGGKMMALIDSVVVDQNLVARRNRNSFAEFVARYGVVVEDNLVFDVRNHETVLFNTQLGSIYRPYPYWMNVPTADPKVTRDVASVTMPWASSLGIAEAEIGRIEVIPLLETAATAAIDFSYGDVSPESQRLSTVTEGEMLRNLMGVAVTRRDTSDGETAGDPFRLVVVGDSDWISDGVVNESDTNLALGLNLIDWLAQEELLASIRSKIVLTRELEFTSTHKNVSRYSNIIGVPLAFVLLGLLRFIRRRGTSFIGYAREG